MIQYQEQYVHGTDHMCIFIATSKGNDLTRRSITSEMFRFQDKPEITHLVSGENIFSQEQFSTNFVYLYVPKVFYLIRIIIPNKIHHYKICPILHYNYLHPKRSTTIK